MIVSWNWLKEYLDLDMPVAEFERRLMMAGFNHESTAAVGDDLAIDLEITSNRPDCLGHLGIAREAAVLFDRPLKLPSAYRDPLPKSNSADPFPVRLECPELCTRYTARVVRGARVAESPAWLKSRLATLGIAAINNVVDITNYVLMECGQPLHAFDLARLAGPEIVVRRGRPGEKLEAIDHRTYESTTEMCVIADARTAQGIGGIMGGAASEVTAATRDVLIEAAQFDPLAIRNAARQLNLHSASSYRFERGVDPEGVDAASRRCAELILELAGGELSPGVTDVGQRAEPAAPVVLRYSQLQRVLGIDIPVERVRAILRALGCTERSHDATRLEVTPPSWRRDLSREIDLVEEAARIHGYDAIPEDARVPMAPSARSDFDRALEKIRRVVTAAGYDEALTCSAVDAELSEAFSPWTDQPALVTSVPVLRGADRLRRSLISSLLAARRANEAAGNGDVALFEIAKIYLPQDEGLPREEWMLALVAGAANTPGRKADDSAREEAFRAVRGIVEAVTVAVRPSSDVSAEMQDDPLFAGGWGTRFSIGGERFAVAAQLAAEGLKRFELRLPTVVAELRLGALMAGQSLVPQYLRQSSFPAIERDLNLVVDERVSWDQLADVVRSSGGDWLEALRYGGTYRHAEQIGPGRKSLLIHLHWQGRESTLTGEEVDERQAQILAACTQRLGAQLRA